MTDLIGERFGKLTVLEYIGNSQWKCRCDCGNITTATTTRLKRGEKTSCGCKIGGFQDLTGQRFGRLMVKNMLEKVDGSVSVIVVAKRKQRQTI